MKFRIVPHYEGIFTLFKLQAKLFLNWKTVGIYTSFELARYNDYTKGNEIEEQDFKI